MFLRVRRKFVQKTFIQQTFPSQMDLTVISTGRMWVLGFCAANTLFEWSICLMSAVAKFHWKEQLRCVTYLSCARV